MKDLISNTSPNLRVLLFVGLAGCAFTHGHAQGKLVDSRDQAEGWYLPVQGQVMAQGERAADCTVKLYKDNKLVGQIAPRKSGKFEVNLDIDNQYSLLVEREGYNTKMIFLDTTLPKDLVNYPGYICFVNLVHKVPGIEANFYHDFPSAIVRWNPEMGGFHHSENYISHIQSKIGNLASATP